MGNMEEWIEESNTTSNYISIEEVSYEETNLRYFFVILFFLDMNFGLRDTLFI